MEISLFVEDEGNKWGSEEFEVANLSEIAPKAESRIQDVAQACAKDMEWPEGGREYEIGWEARNCQTTLAEGLVIMQVGPAPEHALSFSFERVGRELHKGR